MNKNNNSTSVREVLQYLQWERCCSTSVPQWERGAAVPPVREVLQYLSEREVILSWEHKIISLLIMFININIINNNI